MDHRTGPEAAGVNADRRRGGSGDLAGGLQLTRAGDVLQACRSRAAVYDQPCLIDAEFVPQ